MAEDKIDSIIDRGKLQAEFDYLEKNLKGIVTVIQSVSNSKIKVEGASSTKELSLAQNKLAQELKAVESLVNQRFATDAKVITLQTDYAKAIAANKVAIQQQNAELKTQAQLQAANTGSIEKAQAAVKALTKERNQLNLFTEEGQQRQAALNAQIDKYNNFIKKNVDALAQQKINVGNYSGAISVLKTSLEDVGKKLERMNKDGNANKNVIQALEKEYAILNQLVNSQASGFANAAAEIKENQKALLQMTQAGLQGTDAFNKLAQVTGDLKDDLADLKQRTKTLGSDTFAFDALIQGAQTLAGAYGVAQGAAALFGEENEDLQKTFVKLQAIMTVIQGLQAIQNGLQKESAFILGLQSAREKILLGFQSLRAFVLKESVVATVAATAATAANTTATNATTTATVAATAATKAFRIALLATGIGAILVLIVSAAKAMGNYSDETKKGSENVEEFTKRLDKQTDSVNKNIEAINENVESIKSLNRTKFTGEDLKQKNIQTELNGLQKTKTVLEGDFQTKLKERANIITALNKLDKEGVAFAITAQGQAENSAKYLSARTNLTNKLGEANKKLIATNDALAKSQKNIAEFNVDVEGDAFQESEADKEAKSKAASDAATKRSEEANKKAIANAKANARAQFDILKDNANERARLLQQITDDESAGIEERLEAEVSLYKEKQSILLAQRDFDLKQEGLTVDQKKAIQNKYGIDSKIIEEERLKERKELLRKYDEKLTADIKARNDEELNNLISKKDAEKTVIEQNYTNEVDALNKKKLSAEDYAKEREKIDNAYRTASLQAEINYTKAVLEVQKKRGVNVDKELQDLAKLERELSDGTLTKVVKNEKTKEQIQLETIGKIQDAYGKLAGVIEGAINASTTAQKNALQEQSDAIDKKTAKEIEAINASTISEQEKADKIAILNARQAAQKEAIARQQRELDQRKARFDKANSIVNIILNTASAVVEALPNIPLSIFAGALGAAQLAVAIATPIPKFKEGLNKDYEGPAIVGDGGKSEAIVRRDGKIELTPATDTLTHINKGDRILPDAAAFMQSLQYKAIVSSPTQEDYQREMTNVLSKKLDKVAAAVINKKELSIGSSDRGMTAIHSWGARQIKYVNENTNW